MHGQGRRGCWLLTLQCPYHGCPLAVMDMAVNHEMDIDIEGIQMQHNTEVL